MTRLATLLLVSLLATGTTPPFSAEPVPASYREGFDTIREREMRAWLEFLASEDLAGRGTGERGYDLACRYVVSVLQGLGAEPGGVFENTADPDRAPDATPVRSWYQPFSLVERFREVEEARLSVSVGETGEEISLRGAFDVEAPGSIEWSGPLVFAGHGDGVLRDERDEFRVEDESSVFLAVPREEKSRRELVRAATLCGARRLIVVSDQKASRPRGLRFRGLPEYRLEPLASESAPEILWVGTRVADALLSRFGTSCAEIERGAKVGLAPNAPRELIGARIDVRIPLTRREIPSRNVVAFLPGSDASAGEEAIVLGAHLDHVGLQNGTIHPGADDDGSGCAALLGVARALLSNERAPRRSTVLVFFGAEELGLHGSRYYSDHSTWPIDRMVAMLNIDMIGRNEERPARGDDPGERAEDNVRSVHVVGSRRASLELDPWIQRLAGTVGLDLEYDEERVYERSDHYNFARLGVPVAFFFAGFHPDYHRPSDTPEKLNWDKIVRVTRLVYSLAFEIADRPARLRVHRI